MLRQYNTGWTTFTPGWATLPQRVGHIHPNFNKLSIKTTKIVNFLKIFISCFREIKGLTGSFFKIKIAQPKRKLQQFWSENSDKNEQVSTGEKSHVTTLFIMYLHGPLLPLSWATFYRVGRLPQFTLCSFILPAYFTVLNHGTIIHG